MRIVSWACLSDELVEKESDDTYILDTDAMTQEKGDILEHDDGTEEEVDMMNGKLRLEFNPVEKKVEDENFITH